MSRTDSFLSKDELPTFKGSMHLFATNQLALLHNLHMLNSLQIPIELSIVKHINNHATSQIEDEQLECAVLLCPGQ